MMKFVKLALEHKPKLIVAGSISIFKNSIDFKKFKEIADEVNAKLMVDMAHIAGLVAAGLHPNPVEYADFCNNYNTQNITRTTWCMIYVGKNIKDIDKTIFPGIQVGDLLSMLLQQKQLLLEKR